VQGGDQVKKGTSFQIDGAVRRERAGPVAPDALRPARSDRATREARRDYERESKNFEAKITSEQALQKAKLAFDGAEAQERATERRIEQAGRRCSPTRTLQEDDVVTPIDGVVTARPVE
jgi:hypothetical protein